MTSSIFSFCFADIAFALSAWQKLTSINEKAVIFCYSQALYDRILLINGDLAAQIPKGCIRLLHDFQLAIEECDTIYLFTLGTLEIVKLISLSVSLDIKVCYTDCYFDSVHHSLRLINPLLHLFSSHRSALCPASDVLKQVVRQLLYDPLRQSMYFSGDSHCWPSKRLYKKLTYANVVPIKFPTVFNFPPASLLFTLNSTENEIPIDWSYFKESGFSLFYKPHPIPSSDYACYPDFVKPFTVNIDPGQIFFGSSSFLVSFFSFSLASTKQSISLAHLYLAEIHPLLRIYLANAAHLPCEFSQLNSLLVSALNNNELTI